MSEFAVLLRQGLDELQIELDAARQAQLAAHWRLVQEANARFNLTAIRTDTEAVAKHYLDCLLLAPCLQQRAAEQPERQPRLADIGSGAGFPGLVLAVACPFLQVTLLESVAKKSRFLAETARELGLTNVEVLTLRAEEAGQDAALRQTFDVVTARAVAGLRVLLEYALPLLRLEGCFIAYKGPNLAAEEAAAVQALALLGGAPAAQSHFLLPGGETRYLVAYRKVGETPAKYPRRAGMPEKRPL